MTSLSTNTGAPMEYFIARRKARHNLLSSGQVTLHTFRLTDAKYQFAVAGLIQAMATPWNLDLRGHSFDEGDFAEFDPGK